MHKNREIEAKQFKKNNSSLLIRIHCTSTSNAFLSIWFFLSQLTV